jgi:site-specific recombinase XerD
MKPTYYKPRDCYQVIVPPRFSETGKKQRRFFATRKAASDFVSSVNRKGNVSAVELDEEEKNVLTVIRASEFYSPERLAEVWRLYGANGNGGTGKTVAELIELFYARQQKEKRSPVTLQDDRRRLRPFMEKFGAQKAATITAALIHHYFESIPPGTNRRSIHKSLRKFWRWAHRLDHIGTDPMAKMAPMDEWGVNNETITPETLLRLFRVCAGLEAPRADMSESTANEQKGIENLKKLIPYFVLGGLAGMRRCELVSHHAGDPVIEWSDILWKKNLIHVRDEVAKQTRAKDRQRWIPLEPVARALLEPFKSKGRIVPLSHTAFNRLAARRRDLMKLKLPENCLRNSYASYGQTFRASGDVARAMGDLESTIKRFYTEKLEPETGRAWFENPVYLEIAAALAAAA